MDFLERHYPSQLPSDPTEATISDGFGMLGMFDIHTTQNEHGSTFINYSFQNPRKVPNEILVAYEPTIPLMPPNESYIPGMAVTITDAFTKEASPNVCPQFASLCANYTPLVCGLMTDQPLCKKKMNTKTTRDVIQSLEDAIFLGLPQDLVMEHIHEELEFQGIEMHTNHLYHGGCLSYIPVNTSTVAGVLLYPSGVLMDILTVLTFSPILDGSVVRFTPRPENKIERFQLSGTIRQIESFTYPTSGKSYTIVRTDYVCLLLQVSVSDDENTTNVEIIDQTDTTDRITSTALSPFLQKEYIYTTEKKKMVLSDLSGEFHSWKDFPGTIDKTNPLFCHFGAHPREAFVHDQKQAVTCDFRSPPNSSKTLFQLPDPCMPTDQCFCVARQHPTNHFYHYLATQDALILLDQRFPQHAVLQTYHNVKGMPSYLEVSSHDKPENSSIVMVGNHTEKQVHCYIVKDKTDSVPILYSLPWKITPFYEWVEAIDGISRCHDPSIWERLEEPLLGFTSCQVFIEDNRSWNVIQISGAGDLFCQTFIPPDQEGGSSDKIKSEKSLHLCQLWLKEDFSDDEEDEEEEEINPSLTPEAEQGVTSAAKGSKNGLKSTPQEEFLMQRFQKCSRIDGGNADGKSEVYSEDGSVEEVEKIDWSFSPKSEQGDTTASKGPKTVPISAPEKEFRGERCRKRSRFEYHGPCSRCCSKECLFGIKEDHGLKHSASKFRKHVALDPAVKYERKQELYDQWKPLVCEKCCSDCVEDMESYGKIRVRTKGFVKSLKLPWQDDLEQVKTFEKRKQESLENDLMSQKTTNVKQSPSHNASTSLVQLDMDGHSTSVVVSEEMSEMPLSQSSQVTLFTQDSNDYGQEEEDGGFCLDWRPTSRARKIKTPSQPESMGF